MARRVAFILLRACKVRKSACHYCLDYLRLSFDVLHADYDMLICFMKMLPRAAYARYDARY